MYKYAVVQMIQQNQGFSSSQAYFMVLPERLRPPIVHLWKHATAENHGV